MCMIQTYFWEGALKIKATAKWKTFWLCNFSWAQWENGLLTSPTLSTDMCKLPAVISYSQKIRHCYWEAWSYGHGTPRQDWCNCAVVTNHHPPIFVLKTTKHYFSLTLCPSQVDRRSALCRINLMGPESNEQAIGPCSEEGEVQKLTYWLLSGTKVTQTISSFTTLSKAILMAKTNCRAWVIDP